jgi:hypothetical protein
VKITISVPESSNPEVVVEVEDFVGKGCAALTKGLQDAIGTTTKETFKPEYHRLPAKATQQQQQRLGG